MQVILCKTFLREKKCAIRFKECLFQDCLLQKQIVQPSMLIFIFISGHDDINDKTFQLTELDTPQTTSAQEQNDDTLTHGTTESSFNGDVFSSETSSTCSSIDSTIIDRSGKNVTLFISQTCQC